MPTTNSQVVFRSGSYAGYQAITTKDANTLYFCTDTKQLFVGDAEYTKSASILTAAPTSTTVGDAGKLYSYNDALYLCTGYSASTGYGYTRVANINDTEGTVTEITAGEGIAISGDSITSEGSISHAVPTGAAAHSNAGAAQTPDFGGTFNVETIATDKFGHVTGITTNTVTLPEETAVTVETATGEAQTLSAGSTFTAVTGVEVGDADQSIKRTVTTFTLPADIDTTYTIETGTEEGKIKVTPSSGSAYEVTVNGWSDLAKKSELASVFKFKGTVATVSALPKTAEVGDVYHVTDKSAEYVCITASTGSADAVYEELGSVVDLSEYAKSADVIQRVTGATGYVPEFNADGTLKSTGFTIAKSVPADAVFTDTTYDDATQSESGLMSGTDKTKLDGIEAGAEVNVLEGVQVAGADLTIDSNKKVNVTLGSFGVTATAAELNDVANKVSKSGDTITGDLTVTGTITGDLEGTATNATNDAEGNEITTTYATKQEVTAATLVWQEF